MNSERNVGTGLIQRLPQIFQTEDTMQIVNDEDVLIFFKWEIGVAIKQLVKFLKGIDKFAMVGSV